MAKKPTLDDVARKAGVSRTLVSTALRGVGRVSETTRQRILQACDVVGYHPNLNARALATGSSHVIGILLADMLNPFFATVADAVAEQADAHGLTALVATGQRTADGERHAIDQILSLDPQGVVLIGPTLDQSFVTHVLSRVPAVSISRFLDGLSAGSIGLNETEGVRLVVQHLAELGHQVIVHIDGGQGVSAEERRRAFNHWTQHLELSRARIQPGGFSAREGYQACEYLVSEAKDRWGSAWRDHFPTAIWAGNDRAASGVLVHLSEQGLSVPTDVSVMGYDDVALGFAEQFRLSTIYQPVDHMGQLAIERLLHPETHVESVRLTPRLVLRTTTGPARISI